jgi:hypothetical protein
MKRLQISWICMKKCQKQLRRKQILSLQCVGVHFEQGPGGGIVTFDDNLNLDLADSMLR